MSAGSVSSARDEESHPGADPAPRAATCAALAAITLLGLLLRVVGVADRSFWLDEILTYKDSIKPLSLILAGDHSSVHPPLLYVVTHFLVATLGSTEAILRSQAVLFGTLAIPAAYWLARAFAGRGAAFLAAFLLAVSPFHVRYSQEARHYAMTTFFTLIAFAALARGMRAALDGNEKPRARDALLFGLAGILALFSHFGAAPQLAAAGAVVGAFLAREAVGRRKDAVRRLVAFSAAGFGAILLAIFPLAAKLAELASATLTHLPPEARNRAAKVTVMPILENPLFPLEFLEAVAGGALPVLALLLLLGGARLYRTEGGRRSIFFLAAWAFLPLAALLVLPASKSLAERYFLPSLPAFLVCAALGLEALRDLAAAAWPRIRAGRPRVAAAAVLALAAAGSGAPALAEFYGEEKWPWRESFELVASEAEPGDGVIVYPEFLGVVLEFYRDTAAPARPLLSAPEIEAAERDEDGVRSIFVLGSHLNKPARVRRHTQLVAYLLGRFDETSRRMLGTISITRLDRKGGASAPPRIRPE